MQTLNPFKSLNYFNFDWYCVGHECGHGTCEILPYERDFKRENRMRAAMAEVREEWEYSRFEQELIARSAAAPSEQLPDGVGVVVTMEPLVPTSGR